MRRLFIRCLSVFLAFTFIVGQVYAGGLSFGPSEDTLAPEVASGDPGNADTQSNVANVAKPSAIANGSLLTQLLAISDEAILQKKIPRIDFKQDSEIGARLMTGIELAQAKSLAGHSGLAKKYPHHENAAMEADNRLSGLRNFLVKKVWLHKAAIKGKENYRLGFNIKVAPINARSTGRGAGKQLVEYFGLAEDLVDFLYAVDPELLAQYIYHEAVPEEYVTNEIIKKDRRDLHRVIYEEIQREIFGQEQVERLKKALRLFIKNRGKKLEKLLAKARNAGLIEAKLNVAPVPDRTKLRFGFNKPDDRVTYDAPKYNIGPWIRKARTGGHDVIPKYIADSVEHKLKEAVADGRIKGATVHDFDATTLSVLVSHNHGPYNVDVQLLIHEAVISALTLAKGKGDYIVPENGVDVLNQPFEKQLRLFGVNTNERYTFKERAAEPVAIAQGVGVSMAAANFILLHQFAVLGAMPIQKLGLDKNPGFRFVVRPTKDIMNGNPNPDDLEFELTTKTYKKFKGDDGKTYVMWDRPRSDKEQNDGNRLLAILSQPYDHQIVAVYPSKGSDLPEDEPLAMVSHSPAFADGKMTDNPTIIYRSQNGAPAVGDIADIAYKPRIVPGGPNGDYYVTVMPATLEQARTAPHRRGTGYFAVYGWQSAGKGKIPNEYGRKTEHIKDHMEMNPPAFKPQIKMAKYLSRVMATHGNNQPFLSPRAAMAGTHDIRKRDDEHFKLTVRETEPDPVMASLQKRIDKQNWAVVQLRKADMGGLWGHNFVPPLMAAVYQATLAEAVEKGEIRCGSIWRGLDFGRIKDWINYGIGDDGQTLQLGGEIRGVIESKVAFRAFIRALYFYSVLIDAGVAVGVYSPGQDFLGADAKKAKKNPEAYSELSEEFFDLLEKFAPQSSIKGNHLDIVKKKWLEWKTSGKSSTELKEPFSGNVTQQGIGATQYAFDPKKERTFDMIGGDKMGPPAYNMLIMESVFKAADSGEFENGLVFEIHDLKPLGEEIPEGTTENPSKRIFLDAVKDRELIRKYLAHSSRYNVRSVWSKKRKGFDIANPTDYLDRPLLSSTVTRLGILTGGDYVGNDDSVIIGNTKLMRYLHDFLRTRPIIVQGDRNGSHWEWMVPTAFKYAVANSRSHPIVVGARFTVSKDGKRIISQKDLYDTKAYEKIRDRAHQFNLDFDSVCLGQMPPHAADARDVEPAYPLAKMIAEITHPDSPWRVANKRDASGKRRPADQNTVGDLYAAAAMMKAADEHRKYIGQTSAGNLPTHEYNQVGAVNLAADTEKIAKPGLETKVDQPKPLIIMRKGFKLDYLNNPDATGLYRSRMLQQLRKMKDAVVFVENRNELLRVMEEKLGDKTTEYRIVVIDDDSPQSLAATDLSGLDKNKYRDKDGHDKYAVISAHVQRDLESGLFQYFNLNAMAVLGLAVIDGDRDRIRQAWGLATDDPIPPNVLDGTLRIIRLLPKIVKLSAYLDQHAIMKRLVEAAA